MITINGYKSLGKAENYATQPDDRQELVKLVSGAVVVDGWNGARQAVGDAVSLTATFARADANSIIAIWNARTLVAVTLDDGTTINQARIIIRRISYPKLFESTHTILDLEIWRC